MISWSFVASRELVLHVSVLVSLIVFKQVGYIAQMHFPKFREAVSPCADLFCIHFGFVCLFASQQADDVPQNELLECDEALWLCAGSFCVPFGQTVPFFSSRLGISLKCSFLDFRNFVTLRGFVLHTSGSVCPNAC